MISHFRLLLGKTNDKNVQKMQKAPFLAHFTHFWVKQNFPQKSVYTDFSFYSD